LARALTIDPAVIVADEPTGNLDTVSGDELMDLLLKLNKEEGKTVLMVTHDLEYLKYANKLFHIVDGKLVEEFDSKGAAKLAGNLRNKKGTRKNETVRDGNFLAKNLKKYVS
jgi:putative ABC transport system ATP-binding protein